MLWNSDDVVTMAKYLVDSNCVNFQGIYAHDGHSYDKAKAAVTEISSESVTRLTFVSEK